MARSRTRALCGNAVQEERRIPGAPVQGAAAGTLKVTVVASVGFSEHNGRSVEAGVADCRHKCRNAVREHAGMQVYILLSKVLTSYRTFGFSSDRLTAVGGLVEMDGA